jgi:hypothetical protein
LEIYTIPWGIKIFVSTATFKTYSSSKAQFKRQVHGSNSLTSLSNLGSLVVLQNSEFIQKITNLPKKPVGGLLENHLNWGSVIYHGQLCPYISLESLTLLHGFQYISSLWPIWHHRLVALPSSAWSASVPYLPFHYCPCVVLFVFINSCVCPLV